MSTPEVRHEPERSRWAAYLDGEEAGFAEYALREDPAAIVFTHTVTRPEHGGKGVATALMDAAIAQVREADADGVGRPVVPACSFVGAWFDKHPDEADLLA